MTAEGPIPTPHAAAAVVADWLRTGGIDQLADLIAEAANELEDARLSAAARELRKPPPVREAAERKAERDRLLREIADQHFSHLASGRAKADAIAQTVARYQSSAWRRSDRDRLTMPPQYRDRIEGLLWLLCRTDAALSARTIRRAVDRGPKIQS